MKIYINFIKIFIFMWMMLLSLASFVPLILASEDAGYIPKDMLRNQQKSQINLQKLQISDDFATQPDLSFYNLSGEQFSLRKYRDNLIVICFFATWCANCKDELLQLNKLYEKLKFHAIEDIVIFPVSIDFKKAEAIDDFFFRNKMSMPAYLDLNKKAFSAFGIHSLPSSVIINKQGFIVGVYESKINWDEEAVFKDLLLLKEFKPMDSSVQYNVNEREESLHFKSEKGKNKETIFIR